MIITGATLKIDDRAFEILRCSYNFQRDTDTKGRPCSVFYGGMISIETASE